MGDAASLTDADNWDGGFYELTLQLGRGDALDADDRDRRAMSALWAHPALDGCFLDRGAEPEDQDRVNPSLAPGGLYGRVTVGDRGVMVCRTSLLRFEGDADWLTLYLPMGALARIEPRAAEHPIGDPLSRAWRIGLDTWLVSVAETLSRRIAFELALVGFEPSRPGLRRIETMEDLVGDFPPPDRREGYAVPSPLGIKYHPPTVY